MPEQDLGASIRDMVDALRQGTVPNDGCLAALTGFARAMVRNRAPRRYR